MKISLLIGLIGLPFALLAKDDYKFGKVSQEQIAQQYYPKDSSVGAVILYNIGETETLINPANFDINTDYTKRTRIKIYDKNALQLSNQTLVLYNERYSSSGISVYNIKARTYNLENDKVVTYDLPKGSVRIDKLDDYHDIVHFAFTNVRPGSVIEYEIKLHIPGISIPTWYFQDYFPVEYSAFSVDMAEFFKYRRDTRGYLQVPPAEERSESRVTGGFSYYSNISKWEMYNIPAFVEEPFVSCNDNYITQMEHELLTISFPHSKDMNFTTNWSDVLKGLLNDPYHGQLINTSAPFLDDEYRQVKDIKDNLERMKACYRLIQQKMSWNKVGSIFSPSLRSAYKEAKGNSADINFILLKLLRECNIEANPVILSTRDNGFVPRFPSLNKFNYMLLQARVDGKSYLLDATEKYLLPDMLAPRCINEKGLVIKEGNLPEWVDLSPKQSSSVVNLVEINLGDDGTIKGKSTFKRSGYAALQARQELSSQLDFNKQDRILKKAANGMELSSYEVQHKDSLQLPVVETFNFKLNPESGAMAGTLLLQPVLFEQMAENPFKNPGRTYPVEFTLPVETTYVVNIALPDDLVLQEKPANMAISMPDNSAKFSYQVNVLNKSIQLSAKFNVKNTLYSQDQYPDLKEFYARAISKLNEPLILQKKN